MKTPPYALHCLPLLRALTLVLVFFNFSSARGMALMCSDLFKHSTLVVGISKGPSATEPGYILTFADGEKGFFKPLDIKRMRLQKNGDFYQSPVFEVAAYKVSELFGFDLVPETSLEEIVARKNYGIESGSLQKYIEGLTANQVQKQTGKFYYEPDLMWVFDKLIANIDRSGGNYILDSNGRWWAIDNASSFFTTNSIQTNIESAAHGPAIKQKFIETLTRNPNVTQKLKSVSDLAIKKILKGLLTPKQIESLLERRRTILSLLPN